MEYPNIPGVKGCRFLNSFSAADRGVSAKLYHSNSWEKQGLNPSPCASFKIFSIVARANGQCFSICIHQFSQKKRNIIFPGNFPEAIEVNPRRRVRITCMPAGIRNIVISRIAHIPAKNHITKTAVRFQRRKEIFLLKYISPSKRHRYR